MEWPEKIRLLFEKHREGLVTLDQVEKILVLMDPKPKPKPRKRGRPKNAEGTLTALEYRRGRFMYRREKQGMKWDPALQEAFEEWPVDDSLIRKSRQKYLAFRERHKLTRLDREFRIAWAKLEYPNADRESRKQIMRVQEIMNWKMPETILQPMAWPDEDPTGHENP